MQCRRVARPSARSYNEFSVTLHGRSVGGGETMVADGGVGLEADEHGALGGLQHGRHLDTTERPQQRRAG